jgi:3-oxoacyl-[acyl-carrier protein] reductase
MDNEKCLCYIAAGDFRSMVEKYLTGKVALVTGASRGIGRAVALKLSDAGAKVAINFAGNIAKAEEVKVEIEKRGGEAVLTQGNVDNFEVVNSIVKKNRRNVGNSRYFD